MRRGRGVPWRRPARHKLQRPGRRRLPGTPADSLAGAIPRGSLLARRASIVFVRLPPRYLLREEPPPDDLLLVVRGGVNSLSDATLERSASDCWGRYGFFGVSVFGAPAGDLLALSQSSTAIRRRSQVRTARCGSLRSAGFEVAATFPNPVTTRSSWLTRLPSGSSCCGRVSPQRWRTQASSQTVER